MNTSYSFVVNPKGMGEFYDHKAGPSSVIRQIFTSTDLIVQLLRQGSVVVIGDCFPEIKGDLTDLADVLSCIKYIANHHWGRFVAIGHDPGSSLTAIYRDPSGMVPCYYGYIENRVAIGTDASSIITNLGIPSRINWDTIATSLLSPDLRLHETALQGIAEVVPGEMVAVNPCGARREILWNIAEAIGTNEKATFDEATEILEHALVETIQTWCGCYKNPAVSVSGGLDSSIIAAIAARVSDVDLMHFLTNTQGGGEQHYAELLASHIKLPLHCITSEVTKVSVQENRSSSRPRPSARLFTQGYDDASACRAEMVGNSAHFNGGGGDNVLGKLHSAYPLADLQLTEGFSWSLLHVAINVAHATGASLPEVLKQGGRAIWKRDMLVSWPRQKEFLTRRALSMPVEQWHPWLNEIRGKLPGQRQLVRNMAGGASSTDYLNIFSNVPTIYPLLSQPIMEACLSLPTWLSISGGQDRAVARAAMQKYLPSELVNRTSKGAFDSIVYQIFSVNRDSVFDDLENGLLADQGLLDIDAVKAARLDDRFQRVRASRILHIHEIETWCRHWI